MKTKEVQFHPRQYQAFTFPTQYGAAIAGVQSGKTFVGAYWAAQQIAEMPVDGVGLICAPTYKILQQSTIPKFFKEFPNYHQYYKEQKGQIEFPDGRIVYVRSMDDPYGVEGMTLDWAWGDEAGQFSLAAWTVLRSRTSIKRGKILFTTTPYNMGWLYADFYLPWKNGEDKDLTVVTWKSTENPFFPLDFYDKEKKRLRPEEFNRRYNGEFTRLEGLVYNLEPQHIKSPHQVQPDITIGGVDWGWRNPAALPILKLSAGKWYLVDEWYATGKTTTEIIDQMIKLQNTYGVNRWYADSANPEKVAEANFRTGLYVIGYEKKKDSISNGISKIQQLMRENRFEVFSNCKNAIEEFNAYRYAEVEDNLEGKDEPVAMFNHLMDAIRYSIDGYSPAMRFKVTDKTTYTEQNLRKLLDANPKFQEAIDDFL